MPLRPYQETAVTKAINYFRMERPAPSLIVCPTGWGKSWLTAYVARSIPEEDYLLVVQPTKELLEQNYSKYAELCGAICDAGIYSASFNKRDIRKITYATIGSIKNDGARFREMGFTKMLIDEAHLYPRKEESMIGQFLADSGISHVLGITATPLKLETISSQKMVEKKLQDGTPVLDRYGNPIKVKVYDGYSKLIILTNPSNDGMFFQDIIHVGQIPEMISLGFWSPLNYEYVPYDPKLLQLNSSGSEYTDKSQMGAYEANGIHDTIKAALDYHAERRHVLVFVPSVEEAQLLASEYPESEYVCGETPKKERKRIIEEFKQGKIRVLFNVFVLSVGFDYTGIDCIILASSTASIARYYQTVGRGVRINPDKKDCLVIDMCANLERFGRVEDIRFEWDGIWRMYGEGDRLLSGIPIDCIGCFTRKDIYRMNHAMQVVDIFPFGKHKNLPMRDVPASYLRWYLRQNIGNEDPMKLPLLDTIRYCLETSIRDTTGEPPVIRMPSGIHEGKLLADVPKNYLYWLLKSTKWNNMNDSLRRGVELALGEKLF